MSSSIGLVREPELGPDVGQPAGHVLDQDLEIHRPLALGQDGVDLARLGVHQERLQRLAITAEEGVRERAVAPVDAGGVELDEQAGHRVEQPAAVQPSGLAEPQEQAAVLPGVGQVGGDQDRLAVLALGQPDGLHRRQPARLEVPQHGVLAPGQPRRQLLHRVQGPVVVQREEADDVPARADLEVVEPGGVVGPGGQRDVPRECQKARRRGSEMDGGRAHGA